MNLLEHIDTTIDPSTNVHSFTGNIDLSNGEFVTSLPRRLMVGGGINLNNTLVENFESFLVCNAISLVNTPFTGVSNDARHEISCNEADFSNSQLRLLPRNFSCRTLTIENCKNFQVLDADCIRRVCTQQNRGVSVYAKNSSIANLFMRRRKRITKLNDEIDFRFNVLDLENNPIGKLPNDLIATSLNISNTNIEEFPSSIRVKNSLNISNTRIRNLPENLRLGGDLDISNTQLEILPRGLEIGGDLICRGMENIGVPRGTVIRGRIITK